MISTKFFALKKSYNRNYMDELDEGIFFNDQYLIIEFDDKKQTYYVHDYTEDSVVSYSFPLSDYWCFVNNRLTASQTEEAEGKWDRRQEIR